MWLIRAGRADQVLEEPDDDRLTGLAVTGVAELDGDMVAEVQRLADLGLLVPVSPVEAVDGDDEGDAA